jgi:DNA-binding CsgD family transcriptional regulator
MLQGSFLKVLEARDRDDYRNEVVRFANAAGFDTVTAILVVDHTLGDSEFIAIDNTPANYQAVFEHVDSAKLDPVMQHCRRQSVPIIWDQGTYVGAGQGDKWETQAQYGYRTGVCMALHLPEGRHFVLGVDRDRPLPADRGEVTRIVADLQLFAVHAQEAAMRLLLPASPQVEAPSLTPRELEALRWTMEGKTAWEVGTILGISERTAVLHVNNAMHKLDCVNKHQAVLKALRFGLIR